MTKTLNITGLIILMCVACRETPDYYTSQGVGVFQSDEALFRYEIEAIIDDVITTMPYNEKRLRAQFAEQNTDVKFMNHKVDGKTGYTWLHGFDDSANMHVYVPNDLGCVGGTALQHELIHVAMFLHSGAEDNSHSDKTVFRSYDNSDLDHASIEWRAGLKICQQFCGCPDDSK